MRKIFLMFLLFIVFTVNALEWPMNDFRFAMLFGDAYSKGGNFQVGLIFIGDESVKATEYGKKLIAIVENKTLREFPSTLGNALVVAHDKGLQTIYGNLKAVPAIIDENSRIETFSIIGMVGNSGWGADGELTFQVIDTQEKSFINPTRHLLPLLPFNDQVLPTISGTVLVDEKTKQTYRLDVARSVKQGEYDLYSFVKDSMIDSSETFIPFDVSVSVNGKTALDVQFYVLEGNRGELYLKKTKISAEKLYNNEGKVYLGKLLLKRGRTEIVISATDVSQNTTRITYPLQVE
ncbi:MAG: peptidoglycan DD-metalloendopeptidase family protein [Treponema sp.]